MMTRRERRALRRRNREGGRDFSGGVILVGLGFLFLTGWWWPGIMWVIAAATASRGLVTEDPEVRRRRLSAAAFLAMIPFFIMMWSWSWRAWAVAWPLMLIAAGVAILWGTMRSKLPPTWRDSLDELLSSPEPEPAPTRRPEPVPSEEETTFDRLSTIYDPERDEPGVAPAEMERPASGPAEQTTPRLPPADDHIQVDLGSIFGSGERRLDRARRGEH
ncbi:MAG: hypothetical protein M5U01_33130 [Ardenticatenaceae bacterium]|nr:hypothetical protein [Ardenticatenaceae bacterium]